ncbi:DUF5666 domain-containing protein [Acidobacteria bacterium AH-259-D05]|nr:DUF5666 domain-containing protein [Acidobacteria bacterium AH-259-D05]
MKRILPLFFILLSLTFLKATSSQIEFVGNVESIEQLSDEVAVLTMPLTSLLTVEVRVTGQTEIFEGETPSDVPALVALVNSAPETLFEVEGLLTGGSVLAQKIKATEDGSDIQVRGRITDISAGEITVRGFVFNVPEEAEIQDDEGIPLSFEELQINQFVVVKGNVVEDALIATKVTVRTRGEDDEEEGGLLRISFEGIVIATTGEGDIPEDITVAIEGADASSLVRITDETDIKGSIELGVLVRVVGAMEEDASVRAKKIIVKRLLQLAPDKLKMRFNQTRRVEIILRETVGEDVPLAISITSGGEIVSLSDESVTIPAGRVTGFFEVTSGTSEGEAFVDVQMPESLGGLTVTLPVEVRDRGGKPTDPKINWSPGTLNASTEQTKTVRLRLNQPAPDGLMVELTLKDGLEDLVFPNMVTFEEGARVAIVEITTGLTTGNAEIKAALSDDFGGDSSDLKVKVKEKRGE